MLVHDCALLRVSVDTSRLFDGDHRYAQWLRIVTEQVSETRRAQSDAERQAMRK